MSKFVFKAMKITEGAAFIWRGTRNEEEIRLYGPLMFNLKAQK